MSRDELIRLLDEDADVRAAVARVLSAVSRTGSARAPAAEAPAQEARRPPLPWLERKRARP